MKTNKGFGLVEVLVALAIMAVGLLAVAVFHSDLIEDSHENKARAEAIALAQQRLEQMRNYTGQASDADEFNTLFTVTTGYGNDTNISGNNAQFKRQEDISQSADTKNISVMVSWESSSGENEQVVLETDIGFESPSLTGQLGMDLSNDPLVRSATGRAVLGAGQVEAGDQIDTTTNGDSTGLLDRGDGDLRLTNGDEAGDDVVLTLEDACELDSNDQRTTLPCTGFVEISGKVYIDTATKNRLKPGEVYIKASDAAYCQRYYTNVDADGNLEAFQIDDSTTSANLTSNGDYHYFDYTCYLGGGWHGNIGVMLADGITQRDKICQGDPTSADAFADPRIAARRVYRGMAYLMDGNRPIKDANDDIVYYSVGVSDALKLPLEGEAGHNFVISDMAPGSNEGELCILDGIMVRPDSQIGGVAGQLFAGVPTDFYCLNDNISFIDSIKVDAFGYSLDDHCPFDPSDPPSKRHVVSFSSNIYSTYPFSKFMPAANTSDGANNCQLVSQTDIDGGYQVNYQCDVYDWGNGWDGYIEFEDSAGVFNCDGNRQYLTSVVSDSIANDFGCTAIDYDVYGEVTISGNITTSVSYSLLDAYFIDSSMGVCEVDAELSSYVCRSTPFELNQTFTGNLFFNASTGRGGSQPILCINGFSPTPDLPASVTGYFHEGSTSLSFSVFAAGSYRMDLHAVDSGDSCT